MSKQKIKLHAKVYDAEHDKDLIEIARKRGIQIPSTHTALFKSIYAPIEEANRNKVRLAKEAVETALPGLVGAQVNFEHYRRGFIVGFVLDAWINANDEIEIAFTFAKSVYTEEFEKAKSKLEKGELTVSFELLSGKSSQEFLEDGTVRLHDIDFQGVGLLLDHPPAYEGAKVFEMAKKYKQRANSEKELVYASEIIQKCDTILNESQNDTLQISIKVRTSTNEEHWHQAEIDLDGNGKTISTFGEDNDTHKPHIHPIANFVIGQADNHIHILLQKALYKLKNAFEVAKNLEQDALQKEVNELSKKEGGKQSMNEEQKEILAQRKNELGDFANDVSDKELLDDAKYEELKKAKADSESKDSKEKVENAETEEKTEDKVEDKTKEVESEKESEEKSDDEAEKSEESEEEKEEEKVEDKESDDDKSEEEKDDDEATSKESEESIDDLKSEIEELKETLKAKDSELEEVRVNAEKIGKLKVELKDNPYVAKFKDEEYLDDAKVENVRIKHENDQLKAKLETKEKIEKTEKKAEKADNETKTEDKEKVNADLQTGENNKDNDGDDAYQEALKAYKSTWNK